MQFEKRIQQEKSIIQFTFVNGVYIINDRLTDLCVCAAACLRVRLNHLCAGGHTGV